MTCDKVQELLTSYLDNELTEDEYMQISIHLEQCPECSVLLQYIKEMQNTFEDIPEVDPPARIRQNVMKAIAEEETKVKEYSGWQWKRAIAAFVLFAVSIATGLQPLFAMKSEPDTASLRFSVESADHGENIKRGNTEGDFTTPPANNGVTYFTAQNNEPDSSIKEERSEDNKSNDDTTSADTNNSDTDNTEKSGLTVMGAPKIIVKDEDGQPVDNSKGTKEAFPSTSKSDDNSTLTIEGVPKTTLTFDSLIVEEPKWYERIPRERFVIAFSGVIFSLIMLWYSRPKKV